jgi:hypothetical protein
MRWRIRRNDGSCGQTKVSAVRPGIGNTLLNRKPLKSCQPGRVIPKECTAILNECIAIPKDCIAIHNDCIAIHRDRTAIHRDCTEIPKDCIAIHRDCIAIHKDCIAIHKDCIAHDRCLHRHFTGFPKGSHGCHWHGIAIDQACHCL